MAISLESISKGKQLRAPRIVLLGVEKIGKSTFAAGADNPIFIPIKGEEGIDALDVASFPTCTTFDDVMECLGVLYQEDHDYNTIVIDSTSALEPLVWDKVCKRWNVSSIEEAGGNGGGYGKGYLEAVNFWREIMDGFDALRTAKNMACILIGHVKVKGFSDPNGESYDRYHFDLNEKASNAICKWVDSILFANTKVIVKKENQGFGKEKKRGVDPSGGNRYLFTQHRPAHPGGGRGAYGQIPYELPLDWNAFTAAVAEASK